MDDNSVDNNIIKEIKETLEDKDSLKGGSSADVPPVSSRSASQVEIEADDKTPQQAVDDKTHRPGESSEGAESDANKNTDIGGDSQKDVSESKTKSGNPEETSTSRDSPSGVIEVKPVSDMEKIDPDIKRDSSSDNKTNDSIEKHVSKYDEKDQKPNMENNEKRDQEKAVGISKPKRNGVRAALLKKAKQEANETKPSKDEDSDASVKDTDPLLVKTDSQKTIQSESASSDKSDSSSDNKKAENKKKYSYIPIVATGKEKNSSLNDAKRKKSDNAPPKIELKKDSKVPIRANKTGLTGSSQNIAMKDKTESVAPVEAKGETTFSVVSENEKNKPTKNVKWNESDKDKKANPPFKKESRIPELDKKKQNLVQKTLQREKAVLTNGSVKTPEKDCSEKEKTTLSVKEDKKEPLDSTPSVEIKTEPFKPKSILARALMKKAKEGTGQVQVADSKHVVLNGPTPTVKSLTVPSPVPRDTSEEKDDLLSIGSRRDSTKMSLSDSMSRKSVDYRVANATTVVIPSSGQDEEKPKSLVNNDSWIRSAIPYLPISMAFFCLFLNIFIPGTGTVLSGFAILCCGKARVQSKDDQVAITLCTNVWVGVAQLFTVTFMLVGWFWSMAWGIKMVILSFEYRKELRQKREKELQALALSAFGSPAHGRGLFG